jgi:serine/threonine-protein kinase
MYAAFSADGKRIAVATSRSNTPAAIWIQPVTGATSSQDVYRGEESYLLSDWTSDGRTLIGATQRNRSGFDVTALDVATGKFTPILAGNYNENAPVISPDGRWLAYTSNESGRSEVYVTGFPAASSKFQVSLEMGGAPFWSTDGNELFFSSRGKLWSARVRRGDGTIDFDPPQALPIDMTNVIGPRSVTADGRFLFLQRDTVRTPFALITNWTRTLPK